MCRSRVIVNAASPVIAFAVESVKLLNHTVHNLAQIKTFMPPFLGTIRDREDLTFYMHSLDGNCDQCHENLDVQGHKLNAEQKIPLKVNWETDR